MTEPKLVLEDKNDFEPEPEDEIFDVFEEGEEKPVGKKIKNKKESGGDLFEEADEEYLERQRMKKKEKQRAALKKFHPEDS